MAALRLNVRTLLAWQIHIAVLITALAWLSNPWSIARTLNDQVYDLLVRIDARLRFAPDHVLIVYADRHLDRKPDEYLRLLRELRALGAAGFGVTQLSLDEWTPDQQQELSQSTDVVFGDVRGSSRANADDTGPELQAASVELPRTIDGVYRRWRVDQDQPLRSFPLLAARRFAGQDRALPDDTFGISFRGGPGSLPHVTARAVLNGEITSPLVRDRVVVVGRPNDPLLPGIATPMMDRECMSIAEFHGQIINSLLGGRWYRPASQRAVLALYLAASVGFLLFGRRAPLSRAVVIFLMAATLQGTAAIVLFCRGGVHFPLLTLMMVEVLSTTWSFYGRLRFSGEAWQVTRRHGFTVSPRYRSHPHLDPSREPWDLIQAFLQHLFPLDRIALLISDGSQGRLQLVSFTGCQQEEVVERRRDLRRHPFQDAHERKTVVQIDETRPFFERRPAQCQFLCPLMHTGRIQGMVVVELSRTAWQKHSGFTQSLQDACDEIAPWVARYTELKQVATRRERWWNRAGISKEQETFESLQRYLQSLDRHMQQSYAVIENATTGKAVFDLGGNLVTLNAEMFRILHRCGIASHDARLLPTIRSLLKRDIQECRELVRRVLMHGRRERAVVEETLNGGAMLLVISPVQKSNQATIDPGELAAFDVQGVQIEAFEADLVNDFHVVREHVAEQGFSIVEELLGDVLSLTDALMEDDIELSQRQLQSSATQAKLTIQRCQSMLASGPAEDADTLVPLQVDAVVRAAVVETRSLADKCGASVELAVPRDLPDVSANPQRLRQSIATGMEVLMEHARDHSVINVTASSGTQFVTITIRNEGCGVALDQIAAIRRSRPDRPAGNATRLFDQAVWLRSWGGDMTIHSDLGEGATIEYTLPRFEWHERHAVVTHERTVP